MAANTLKKIMVFGTFDLLHLGHESFFRQAKYLVKNGFLIVSVARDSNVKKIKGILPKYSETKRKEFVAKIAIVDKVVLGGKVDYLPHIVKESPHIIALGYDQNAYSRTLAQDLKQAGLTVKIVRLNAYKPNIYKSSKLKAKATTRYFPKALKMGTISVKG